MKSLHPIVKLILLVGVLMSSAGALAATPANSLLTNTAKLVYDGNPTGITTSVTVSVELIPTAVTIAATFSAPQASVNKAENQTYAATYVVQSNANGPDTYTVATTYENTNNITGQASPTVSTASITLGATAASAEAASGQAVITVPADGTGTTVVNGLEADDKVVIGGAIYEILSVVDNATGTSTITLKTNLASTLAIGGPIYEYKTFTVNITDVGSRDTGSVFKLDLKTTVTSDTSPNPVYTFDVDINIVAIDIKKYVRETSGVCGASCSGAATVSYDADGTGGNTTFYDTGVTAAPAETLEYILVITTSTAGITTALITDVLPQFTTYAAGSTYLNGILVDDEASAPIFPLDSGADGGGLLIDDNGARTAGTEGTGSIGTSQTVYVTYRVTVDS